jgi:hypothetical protein
VSATPSPSGRSHGSTASAAPAGAGRPAISHRTPAVSASVAGIVSSPPTAHSAIGGYTAVSTSATRVAVPPTAGGPSRHSARISPSPLATPRPRATAIAGIPAACPAASSSISSGLLKPSTRSPPGFHTNPSPEARFSA